jgi:hypothetical protein
MDVVYVDLTKMGRLSVESLNDAVNGICVSLNSNNISLSDGCIL